MTTRVLLICDFPPSQLENVLAIYPHLSNTYVEVIRRGNARIDTPEDVGVTDIPLPVIGTLGAGKSALMFASLNSLCYLIVGTFVSTVRAVADRCQVVHARFLFPEGIVAYVVSALLRTRLVVTAEGFDVNLYLDHSVARFLVRLISKRAVLVTVNSPMKTALARLGVNSVLIPNHADGQYFRFVPIDQKQKLIIFVGTLDLNKRPDFLLEALALIRDFLATNEVKTLIVGDGPLRSAVEKMLVQLGLSESVVLAGYLPREQVRDLMARACLFVNCSLTEGMSLAMTEAMASGCVVAASDIPANSSQIEGGKSGLLFNPEDPKELAAFIVGVFSEMRKYQALGKAARKHFEAHYDVRAVASLLSTIYDGAVASDTSIDPFGSGPGR